MKWPMITRTIMLLAVSGLVLGIPATAGASASGSGTGWIRLAHLSPNTPAVDVYLYSFGNSKAQLVLRHVSYGTVSPYEAVAAGEYSVAMRAAGASATSQPVLSATVVIKADRAYTVAGMGPASGLRLQVLDDQLTAPPGRAAVRVIQASLQQHVVTVTCGGHVLASGLAFASVSTYQAVPAATETVHVTGTSKDADATVSLAADTVHTLVVLDGTNGLMIVDLQDAAGSSAMPIGGAATGLGGTAPHGPPSPVPWLVIIAAGSLLALAGSLRLAVQPARLPRAPRPGA
jgi:hypothetical protein